MRLKGRENSPVECILPGSTRKLTNLEIDQENEKLVKVEDGSEKFDCPRKIFKASVCRPPTIQSKVNREGFPNSRRRCGGQRLRLLRRRVQPIGSCQRRPDRQHRRQSRKSHQRRHALSQGRQHVSVDRQSASRQEGAISRALFRSLGRTSARLG